MAGAFISEGKMLPVMFVRHGQSTNNPIYEGLYAQQFAGEITAVEREERWLSQRKDDPGLTTKGVKEAEQLGDWLRAGIPQGKKAIVYTSPFYRTLQTTQGLCTGLDSPRVIVVPTIYETGGVYNVDAAGKRGGPGACMTAAEIQDGFVYDVSRLPAEGQWYTGGWETDKEGRARAKAAAEWIHSDEFRVEVGDSMVFLVMHGHFIDQLQKAILKIPEDDANDPKDQVNSTMGQQVSFATPNTATSMFMVKPNAKGVSCLWIGRTDHLKKTAADALARL